MGQGSGNFQGFQWENTANYTTKVQDKHNLDFLLGTSYRTTAFRQVGGSTQNIPMDAEFNPNFHYIDAGQDTLDQSWWRSGGLRHHQHLRPTALQL